MGSLGKSTGSFPPRGAGPAIQAAPSVAPEYHPSLHKHWSRKRKAHGQESERVMAPKRFVLLSLLFHWPRVITWPNLTSRDWTVRFPSVLALEKNWVVVNSGGFCHVWMETLRGLENGITLAPESLDNWTVTVVWTKAHWFCWCCCLPTHPTRAEHLWDGLLAKCFMQIISFNFHPDSRRQAFLS